MLSKSTDKKKTIENHHRRKRIHETKKQKKHILSKPIQMNRTEFSNRIQTVRFV